MTTIRAIEVFPVRVPVRSTFTFASGTAGAAGEEAILVYVRVRGDEGAEGWGEGRPLHQWSYESPETMVSTIRRYLAPALIGTDALDRRGLHARMNAAIGAGPSTGQPVAKAAIDMALHDLAARRAGMSLREFLGGARERRDLSISYTITGHTVEAAKREADEALAAGFTNFNFKAAVARETDIAVAKALKAAIPPGGFLWADANQGFRINEAKHVAGAFEEIGVDVLEQPLPADQFSLMGELRRCTRIPLAIDEASVSPADFFNHARAGLVDFLIIKATRSGGLRPTLTQVAVAEAAGLPMLVSGLTDGLLTKLAVCGLASAFGVTGPVALNGSQFLDESGLYPDKAAVESHGSVHLNDRPGIGVVPDAGYLAERAADL